MALTETFPNEMGQACIENYIEPYNKENKRISASLKMVVFMNVNKSFERTLIKLEFYYR